MYLSHCLLLKWETECIRRRRIACKVLKQEDNGNKGKKTGD